MSRLKVVLATDCLGLGGTEKGLVNYAVAFDRERVDVRVVTLAEEGPRREQLDAAGIRADCAHGHADRLATLLDGADVVHVFRIGLAQPMLPAAAGRAGVPVLVETNIFGQVDASSDEARFACHLFISKMCALRYRGRVGLPGPEFHRRHAVSYLPLDGAVLRAAAPSRPAAKALLGLDPERPVVTRVGRDDDRKWRPLLVDMLPELLRRVPGVQVLFVGATPAIMRRLSRLGLLHRVQLQPLVVAEDLLAAVYAASDVFINAAEIGESQGMVLAEAHALGVPIVTCSTPWVDNAQVEMVDNGVDGYVADHPLAFAEAVAALLEPERNAAFGGAGRDKTDRLLRPPALSAQLERLYRSLLAGEGIPGDWSPSPGEVDAFAGEYRRRLHDGFRPLTRAERRTTSVRRLTERARWALRALRNLDRRTLAFLYWQIRAKLGAPGGPR